jgi:protein-S-isoprenylcysteine O-methyltransferase Ste14
VSFALLATTLVAEALAGVSVVLSILRPSRRLWPPARDHPWTGYLVWLLFVISALGTIAVGFLDWSSLELQPWVRWGLGCPLWLGGSALALWAIWALSISTTFGDDSGLVRRGPYRLSRNPQYVGFMLGLAGWALATSSRLTLVASLVGVIPLVLVPIAEESWLAATYGAEYQAYKQSTTRFFLPKGR